MEDEKKEVLSSEESENSNQNKSKINVDKILEKDSEAARAGIKKGPKKDFLDLNFSWFMLVFIGLATFGIAFAVQKLDEVSLGTGYIILFVIIAFAIAIVAYNLGKILFGYVTGYKVGRIEVLGLQLTFTQSKTKAKYLIEDFAELHLVMVPRKGNDSKPTLMFLGGVIFYAITAAVILGVSFLDMSVSVSVLLRYGTALGSLIVFYELCPVKLDVPNDMYLLIVTSGEENTKAYNDVLKYRYAEMLGEFTEPISYASYENSKIKAQTLVSLLHSEVYAGDYKAALTTLDKIEFYKSYINDNDIAESMYEKMYVYLIHGRSSEAGKYVLTMEHQIKKTSDFHPSISTLRTDISISGLVDNSLDESKDSIEEFKKECEFLGETDRVKMDLDLANNSIARINKAHPDWRLENISLTKKKEIDTDKEDDD